MLSTKISHISHISKSRLYFNHSVLLPLTERQYTIINTELNRKVSTVFQLNGIKCNKWICTEMNGRNVFSKAEWEHGAQCGFLLEKVLNF